MTLTLETVIGEVLDQRFAHVHTALPGRVEKYYPEDQTADVKPQVYAQGVPLPVLTRLPVAFPRGGGGFLSFPLVPGDFVFVLFAESSLDQWRAKASDGNPGDERRHSLTGGVALPCLYPTARKLADADAEKIVLGFDGGFQVTIHPSSGITLGTGPVPDALSLASVTNANFTANAANLTTLIAALSTAITTLGNGLVTPDGGATAATFNLAVAGVPASPADVASAVVKAD